MFVLSTIRGRDFNMSSASAEPSQDTESISVFLSYSREDRARAMPLIKALETEGFSVWWDGLLEGGTAFALTTETALEMANAVVVLWSMHSVQSHWVRDEATHGRDRGCMVPVSIDGTSAPLGFRQIQHINLSRWKGKQSAPAFTELVRAIRSKAAATGSQLRSASVMDSARLSVSRRTALVGAGAAIAIATGGFFTWRSELPGGGALANSVVVLPFKNLGGDPEQAYFSDGLSEELRSTLSLNKQLEVAAETSSNSFRDKAIDAKTIARTLNVAYILDGSVRRAGETLRITTQLIDGKTGFDTWSQSFDRKMGDVFAIQSEIATFVVDALVAKMAGDKIAAKSSIGGTTSTEAFDAFLKGRAAYESVGGEDVDRKALAWFDKAIALDPDFAKAHAARSRTLASIAAVTTQVRELRLLYESAIVSAKTALKLAPELADAYSALAFALVHGRQDMRAAREPFEQSRTLGWGDADVLTRFADYCVNVGRVKDAEAATKRVLMLDPLNPRVFRVLGLIQSVDGRYQEAISSTERALAINPKMGGAHAAIGLVQFRLGALDKARQSYDQETFDLFRQTGLSIIDYRRGDKASADKTMAAILAEYGDNALYQKAEILAQRGDMEGAMDALERGHEIGDAGLLLIRNDPYLDPLRSSPRFIHLLNQMGFD
jgi:TolB-like protein/tetratricopeptide (TPR) repeat protein